jgi:hypothetical protein
MTDLHTIRTAGNKQLPDKTMVRMQLDPFINDALRVQIKLPGQEKFSNLGSLKIVNGIIELPVKLIFFSYAREDQYRVNKIARKLWQDGYLTWVDKKDLLPGDDWEVKIEDAIERSDYVLTFLSPSSIIKTGYVQKEFKYALEQQTYRPNGKRFIIPILLKPCDPPHEFKKLQWLRYWEEGAYEKLKQALTG